jgi:quinol monooxygenase YgiN
VENPSSFAFVVEWDSLEAHAAAKETATFATFRAAFGDCAIGGTMQHYHFA